MNAQPALASNANPLAGRAVLRAFGDEVTIHLDGRQTGGKFCMFSIVTPPGGGPPPHYHGCEDEWFYVIEGRASFYRDGHWTEAPAGSSVFLPKGVVHAFKNIGTTPLKQLVHTAPAGFEIFFSRCAEEFANPAAVSMERIVEISAQHEIYYTGQPG